jgi:hypothetical protein
MRVYSRPIKEFLSWPMRSIRRPAGGFVLTAQHLQIHLAVSSLMVRLTRGTRAFGLEPRGTGHPKWDAARCPASFGRWPGHKPVSSASLRGYATGSSAITASTLFQPASLRKQVRAYALLTLQERGAPSDVKLNSPSPAALSILEISLLLPPLASSADHTSAATSDAAFPENSPPEARSRPAVYGSGRPSCRLAPSRFAGGLDS